MARYIMVNYTHEAKDQTVQSGTVLLYTEARDPYTGRNMGKSHDRAAAMAREKHGSYITLSTTPIGVMHTTMNGNLKKFVPAWFLPRNEKTIFPKKA